MTAHSTLARRRCQCHSTDFHALMPRRFGASHHCRSAARQGRGAPNADAPRPSVRTALWANRPRIPGDGLPAIRLAGSARKGGSARQTIAGAKTDPLPTLQTAPPRGRRSDRPHLGHSPQCAGSEAWAASRHALWLSEDFVRTRPNRKLSQKSCLVLEPHFGATA